MIFFIKIMEILKIVLFKNIYQKFTSNYNDGFEAHTNISYLPMLLL